MKNNGSDKGTFRDPFKETDTSTLENKKLSYFEHAPTALWVEDFSKAKTHVELQAKKHATDVKSYLVSNPDIIYDLLPLVTIKDVNTTAIKLYKAKSKRELLDNFVNLFTKESYDCFLKMFISALSGELDDTERETTSKTIGGEIFNIAIKFKVIDGCEDTLENVIVSIENINKRIALKKALIESENRYKESQKIAKIGSWFYDYQENKLHWSDEAYKIVGAKPKDDKLDLNFYLSFIHPEDRKVAENFSIKSLLKNPIQNIKYRVITKNGELKYINEKRTVVIRNGKIVKVLGVGQDVTDSVLAAEELNTTKNLLSKTLTSIEDGFVILDENSNYLYVNPKASELLGKEAKYLKGKHIWTEFPEKEGDLFFDKYQEAKQTNKPISFENYFKPWNRWFENRIIPTKDGMLIFFHEITERKISESKIKAAYNIINKSPSVAVLCKNEYNFPIEFVSENSFDLLGYTCSELLSNEIPIYEAIHPKDVEWVSAEFLKLSKGAYPKGIKISRFRVITKEGEEKWVRCNADAILNEKGEITHIQGIVEDITDKKKTEDLFFESNRRLKEQFNNTPLASIMWDVDFKVLEWNNAAERIFGYTEKEAKGSKIKDLITPPHLKEEMSEVMDMLLSERGGKRNTNENVTKSGKIITCDWYNVTLKDSRGNVTGIASLVDDITEKINSKKLLEKSEKKYRDIFEKAVDAVFILEDGIFVDCNEAALKMFKIKDKKQLANLHPSHISPETQLNGKDSFSEAEKYIQSTIKKGNSRFRWYHKRLNDAVFPAEVTLTRIDYDERKKTIHAVVQDITERVKKEELEKVLYNISRASLAIEDFTEFNLFIKKELNKIIDTSNFYIALYNDKTNEIDLAFTTDDVGEKRKFPAEKTLTGHVIKIKKPLLVTEKTYSELIENGIVNKKGIDSKIWVGVPLKLRDKVFGTIVVQSYTNKNAYTEEDLHLLEFVADQISTIIQRKQAENELKKALSKAQESDRLKSAFLENISHEIRTPMNGIIGFSELLIDSKSSFKDKENYAKIVINSGKRLLSIVNDILDLSQIEAGTVKINLERVNINALLKELYSFYSIKAAEKNIVFKYETGLENKDSHIEIDQTKLNQILTNLLSNSFKFTDEGEIIVGYKLIENHLKFYVKDSGIGIDKELQDKIFDRFVQADVTLNRLNKGTGLGLAISKKLVELFGGKIWVEPSNTGTTICFTIPYKEANQLEINTVIKENKNQPKIKDKKMTILVAEDEEYNIMYLNELFSKTNFEIIEANNGKQAVEIVQKNPKIDLVLMDIKMPIMNGFEAMAEIKKTNPSVPIVAVSAFAMESDKRNALNNGFDAYLTKPINKEQLFETIEKHID
ncbi:PAS domain S-box protein [Lutibacter sp.]